MEEKNINGTYKICFHTCRPGSSYLKYNLKAKSTNSCVLNDNYDLNTKFTISL